MKSIAVIGGGITGVTAAYALARRGLDVTLFEKHRYAGMETSFANGGQLVCHECRRHYRREGITVELADARSQAAAPTVSLLDAAAKLVTSRLGLNRFRVAGTAVFDGLNTNTRTDRIRPLVGWLHACFQEVRTRQVVPGPARARCCRT